MKDFSWHGRFLNFQYKFWELLFTWANPGDWCKYFGLQITWTRHTDHAGFNFMFSLMRFSVEFTIYDNRHWDHDKNKWEPYGRTGTELDL